jgi:hypothetical protein
MTSLRLRACLALSFVLALMVSACDQPTPSAPDGIKPQAAFTSYSTVHVSDFGTSSVEGVVDSAGGYLTVNGHLLTIMPGSLQQPTWFRMTTKPGLIAVELEAKSVATGLPVTLFPSPVRLSLSYASVKLGSSKELAIAWMVNGVIMTIEPSKVDRSNKMVEAWLYHFSDYGLVAN